MCIAENIRPLNNSGKRVLGICDGVHRKEILYVYLRVLAGHKSNAGKQKTDTIMRKLTVIAMLLFCFTGKVNSQTAPEDITNHFFELYQEKGSDAAVDYIFSTNVWLSNAQSEVTAIKVQLKKGIAIIGQYYGFELIEKKMVGESYAKMAYLLRYSRQPIKFTFILYKPDKVWQVQNMKFDDRLESDIGYERSPATTPAGGQK